MLQKKIITILLLVFLLNLSAVAQTNETQDSTHVNPQKLQLPENVKTVLIHEMAAITKLMGHLLEYIVQGDAISASRAAVEIRNTNLKQEFNSQEIKQIMKILPKGFIQMDRKFHMTANELAKAVDTNDFKTAINLYSEMTQSCFNCHSAYAGDRFENLKPE